MGTKVTLHSGLPPSVHICDRLNISDPEWIFEDCQLLVIDGTDWQCDMDVLRASLIAKQRAFKAPFGDERRRSKEWDKAVAGLWSHTDRMFRWLYNYKVKRKSKSFRPMITGPEPMHFDTYSAPATVTSFVNLSAVPRIYNIGRSLPQLIKYDRDGVASIVKSCKGNVDDFSYIARQYAAEGKGPLGPKMPRHRVEFAPGSIWFFDPKTVSHEVVYGEGAFAFSWEVPGAALSQRDWLRKGGLIQ